MVQKHLVCASGVARDVPAQAAVCQECNRCSLYTADQAAFEPIRQAMHHLLSLADHERQHLLCCSSLQALELHLPCYQDGAVNFKAAADAFQAIHLWEMLVYLANKSLPLPDMTTA